MRSHAGRAGQVALALVVLLPSAGHGLFKAQDAAKLVGLLRSAPDLVGPELAGPAGLFLDAATTPTIQTVESSGHHLIADLDDRLTAQFQTIQVQLDKTVKGQVDHVDTLAEAMLGHADADLQARIGQVDAVAAARVRQVDAVLQQREAQLDQTVKSAIAQADEAARARIEQIDEVAERRIGSADAIITKQSLNLEEVLTRSAFIVALAILLAFILWRLFTEVADASRQLEQRHPARLPRALHAVWLAALPIVLQVGFAALGGGRCSSSPSSSRPATGRSATS